MKNYQLHFIKNTLLIILVPLLICANAFSSEVIEVSSVNYPPLILDKVIPGVGYGVGRDVVTEAFKAVGVDTQYDLLPMARSVWSVIEKKHVANMGNIAWFKKQGSGHLVDSVDILIMQFFFFYKKSRFPDGITYENLSDLKEYTIGNVRGSASARIIEKAKLNSELVSNIKSNFKKLHKGRIDFAVGIDITGWMLIKELFPESLEEFSVIKKPISKTNLSLVFLKDKVELKAKFIKGMETIVRSGKYYKILENYYGEGRVPDAVLPKYIKAIINK
jgi:polar amino acid transport system substrate-binding protein